MSDHTESIAALGHCRRCGVITRQAQPYCYQCALMQLDEERAAHAAQLVALREDMVRTLRGYQERVNAASRRPDGTTEPFGVGTSNGYEIAIETIEALPLPDAEAALAKVREEAVREAVGKMTYDQLTSVWVAGSGYWHPSRPMARPIPNGPASGAAVGCCFHDDMRKRLLGHAITALGAQP